MGFFGGLMGVFVAGGGVTNGLRTPPHPKDPPGKKIGGHNPMEPMRHTASIRDIRESQYGSGFFWGGYGFFGGLIGFFGG